MVPMPVSPCTCATLSFKLLRPRLHGTKKKCNYATLGLLTIPHSKKRVIKQNEEKGIRMSNHRRVRANDPDQLSRYKSNLRRFMNFLDGANYPESHQFTDDQLGVLEPMDIYRWLATMAYGTVDPGPEDDPVHMRASSLEYLKKSISHFMPNSQQPWNALTKAGNPTKSKEVNSLIKAVKRKEVRDLGAPSKADRALTLDEHEQALRIMDTYEDERKRYLYAAIAKFQHHMIGRMDDSCHTFRRHLLQSEQYPFVLTIQMRWSKNVCEERDAPLQIILASMNSLHCVHLALGVYLELFIGRGEDAGSPYLFNCIECNNCPATMNRKTREFIEKDVFGHRNFVRQRAGHIGSHSIRKRGTTRARESGIKKDHVDYRSRWKNLARLQDRYTETTLVYPDAEVAAVLCHGGPCEYAIKEGANISNEWIISHVTPNINRVYGQGVATVLGKAILWAVFAEDCAITIPEHMKQKIRLSYERLASSNRHDAHSITQPVEKFLLVVSSKEEAVIIERSHKRQRMQRPEEAAEGNVVNLQQITEMDKRVIDMQNNMENHFRSIDSRLEKMERNIGRIAMIPFGSRQRTTQHTTEAIATSTASVPQEELGPRQARPSFECSLMPNPRDLFVLWQEYEVGVGGRKAAKLFTRVEKGQVKFKYCRRKIVWDCIHRLVRSGHTSDNAIDEIYKVYGRSSSVTTIINRMREDAKRGGHPALN
jgi:hypothetical protein